MGTVARLLDLTKSNPFGMPLVRKGQCRYQCKFMSL
uniref:Uncharacterized protein n=1 Tax=Parascaris equorum TaxID=6256 RepID=A0A914S3E0_PAREQ